MFIEIGFNGVQPLAQLSRDFEYLFAGFFTEGFEFFIRAGGIHLIGHNQTGTVCQLFKVEAQLFTQVEIILRRITVVGAGHVDYKEDEAGALNVPQKLVPQPHAVVGALNQPGDIGDPEPVEVFIFKRTYDRIDGGKGIGGNLGVRMGQLAEEGGFSGVGIADQTDVRHQLQLEPQLLLLSLRALGKLARGLIGGAFKVDIAYAAFAALGHRQLFAVRHQLADIFIRFSVRDNRAHRNLDNAVGAVATVALRPHAVLRMRCALVRLIVERQQRILVGVAAQNHRSAIPAVTAVGAALGDKLFAAERGASVAAVAGAHVQLDPILEDDVFHGT